MKLTYVLLWYLKLHTAIFRYIRLYHKYVQCLLTLPKLLSKLARRLFLGAFYITFVALLSLRSNFSRRFIGCPIVGSLRGYILPSLTSTRHRNTIKTTSNGPDNFKTSSAQHQNHIKTTSTAPKSSRRRPKTPTHKTLAIEPATTG